MVLGRDTLSIGLIRTEVSLLVCLWRELIVEVLVISIVLAAEVEMSED